MGGLSALSFPNGKFITYTRNSDSYELLLTNFVDGTDAAWFDFYVERPSAVGVELVHREMALPLTALLGTIEMTTLATKSTLPLAMKPRMAITMDRLGSSHCHEKRPRSLLRTCFTC